MDWMSATTYSPTGSLFERDLNGNIVGASQFGKGAFSSAGKGLSGAGLMMMTDAQRRNPMMMGLAGLSGGFQNAQKLGVGGDGAAPGAFSLVDLLKGVWS